MKTKKNIIMISMCIAVVFMVIGFAALQTNFTITSTGNIASKWLIEITNIKPNYIGEGYDIETPSYTGMSASFHAGFNKPGDAVEYTITVRNNGTVNAIIQELNVNASGSDDIIYSVSGLEEEQILYKERTTRFKLLVEFDRNATSISDDMEKTINIDISCIQAEDQSDAPFEDVPEEIPTVTFISKLQNQINNAQSDANINFNHPSIYRHYTYEKSKSTTQITFEADKSYDFAKEFIFDDRSGGFELPMLTGDGYSSNLDIEDGKNAINQDRSHKYVCLEYTSGRKCDVLYEIVSYSSSNVANAYVYSNVKHLDDNGNGLFYTNNKTEDNKTVYYYRGNVENNYVKFGKISGCAYNGEAVAVFASGDTPEEQCESVAICDMHKEMLGARYWTGLDASTCAELGGTLLTEYAKYGTDNIDLVWRITRVNEDGSIRLILNTTVGSLEFNNLGDDYRDNASAGYMYGTANATGDNAYALTHANTNDSLIKTYLDEWYANSTNLLRYTSIMSKDAGFCNDRSIAPGPNMWNTKDTALGYGQNITYYGAYHRTMFGADTYDSSNLSTGNNPQFKCPQTNDLFTVKGSSLGNKKLDYPIGMLTADEAVYAGMTYGHFISLEESNNYLILIGTEIWLMSPLTNSSGVSNNSYGVRMAIISVNSLDSENSGVNVRPVINILPTAKVYESGTGTIDNPYVIE